MAALLKVTAPQSNICFSGLPFLALYDVRKIMLWFTVPSISALHQTSFIAIFWPRICPVYLVKRTCLSLAVSLPVTNNSGSFVSISMAWRLTDFLNSLFITTSRGLTLLVAPGGTKARAIWHDPECQRIKVKEQREFTED